MTPARPLVSCLMVALPSAARFAFVKRSIAAYMDQTYDRRELLIVLDQGPKEAKAAICDHVATLRRDDIRIIETAGVPTLGALRNFSRAHAQGELHCQWDDDDLHHPERVERQLEELTRTGAQAVCLQEVMQFFTTTGELYWTNWRATEATVMPATLLCQATVAARYPETGPTSRLGEDTEICTELLRQGQLHAMPDAPHLFVYVNHGANTWGDDFHRMLADRLGLSQGLLKRREARIKEFFKVFDFGAGVIEVRGPNGLAFTVTAASPGAP